MFWAQERIFASKRWSEAAFRFDKEMRVGGGRGAGKIPAISHYPAQTKREQFNNDEEKYYTIKQLWSKARQYDTIPETTRAGGQQAVDEIARVCCAGSFLLFTLMECSIRSEVSMHFFCKMPQPELDLVLPA
jgi:hypothetical protein